MQSLAARGVDAARAGEQSGLFTRLEARLVRAALDSGSPGPTYQRLAQNYAERARQGALMRSRLTLPAFVLLLALVIQPLPALISGAIGLKGYAWQVSYPVLAIVAVVAVLRAAVGAAPRRMPVYGPVFLRTNLRDFFESLGMLLEAGVPMLEALPAALDTVSDGGLKRELAAIRQRLERKETFARALEAVPSLRASSVLALAHTGEQSGTLPAMLMRHAAMESERIAGFYRELAAWLPRIVYALVAIKIAAGIFSSGVGPRVPPSL
jgi:type II secretory pathway component PulF